MLFLAELYWEFCRQTMGEDVSGLKTYTDDIESFTVTEAEARIYAYLHNGFKIKVAYYNNVMAGFLIYHRIFANLYAINALFIEPWASGTKLGKQLISSLQPNSFKIIFKTLKEHPPVQCLSKSKRRVQISEDDSSFCWIIEWGM